MAKSSGSAHPSKQAGAFLPTDSLTQMVNVSAFTQAFAQAQTNLDDLAM
jgi:hypothetical protein